MLIPFQPGADTATVSATTTSTTAGTDAWSQHPQLLVTNAGPDTVFVRWGESYTLPSNTTTATTNDLPVLAGAAMVVTKGNTDLVAVRAASSTATVYLTPGTGL